MTRFQRGWRRVVLSFPLVLFCVMQACGSNPCAQEWYAKCSCCENDQQKTNCRAYMERTNIAALPYRIPEEQLAGCRKKATDFRCADEATLNLREWCNPPPAS